ncbi:hypothetical protein POTOM_010329 [Populus tomentosa]|uniref:Uncharacterized protein n=1 Tax=Populus tomentosa TaxID=118781 RepID=A0A8X8AD28_POPTO|nr:hypothetical protein POTOM_010329 [Populus tomentosa]
MELIDAAFPLLQGILATTDVNEACRGVNIAVMVGGFPYPGGSNPANTNALILKEFATSIPVKNITYANYATAATDSGEKSVRELVADDHWIDSEYINSVRERGLKINEFSREKMDTSMKALTREESLACSCLNQT